MKTGGRAGSAADTILLDCVPGIACPCTSEMSGRALADAPTPDVTVEQAYLKVIFASSTSVFVAIDGV